MIERFIQSRETNILLDTMVISYYLKRDTRSRFYDRYLLNNTNFISFVSVAELYYWSYVKSWGANRINQMKSKISEYALLPFDQGLCIKWAEVKHLSKGHPMQDNDCWIAACALYYDCYLATDNWKDFKHINTLKLISPDN